LTDAEWQVYAAGVEQIAASVRKETGLRLVFHHHCAGFIETPAEVENCWHSPIQLVGLCLDIVIFNLLRDPLTFYKKMPELARAF
jgi:inosose dehydratase